MNQLMAMAWALLQPNKTQNKAQNDLANAGAGQGHQGPIQGQHQAHPDSRSAHSDLRDRSTNMMDHRLRRTSPSHHQQDIVTNGKAPADRDCNPQGRPSQQQPHASRDGLEQQQNHGGNH